MLYIYYARWIVYLLLISLSLVLMLIGHFNISLTTGVICYFFFGFVPVAFFLVQHGYNRVGWFFLRLTFPLFLLESEKAYAFSPVFATVQMKDEFIFYGQKGNVDVVPSILKLSYLNNDQPYPFVSHRTDNHRGHLASWEVSNETLYLRKVAITETGMHSGEYTKEVALEELFPGKVQNQKVKASWFTGILRAGVGER